ncbi:hypothetical protein SEMRO_1377_G267570.1 [Seminavis robusta]|uniref:Uncharacterized protein n=1 Tax=Seminavis robusta TaxID=568900 RepID=A0A9N8HSF0_9STRA|nr:hypothetical protein SEMRO_1377_G267570.1 [Seminavis robusta]|eukprot:Sro1377_g267570.1 n/a (128) ;mRNA; r:27245-27628
MNQSPFDLPDDEEEGEIGETTPEESTLMDKPPLREMPPVETVNDDDNNIASHKNDEPEKGSSSTEEPFIFNKQQMRTDNPTESGLPPEQMIEMTFLMLPAEDDTRVRAKILLKESTTTRRRFSKIPI